MNGFEAMQKMNDEKLCTNCMKVVLSNKSEQKDIEEGARLGVAGYIVKANSTPAEVITQVIKILENKTA